MEAHRRRPWREFLGKERDRASAKERGREGEGGERESRLAGAELTGKTGVGLGVKTR